MGRPKNYAAMKGRMRANLEGDGWRAGPGRPSSGLRGLASLAPFDLRRGGQGRGRANDRGKPNDRRMPSKQVATVYFSLGLDTMAAGQSRP